VKAKVRVTLTRATATISELVRLYLSNIPGKQEVKELQKTATLGTAPHILQSLLNLSLLMSYIYIYMELLVKTKILKSYMYGPTFGNAENHLFLFAAQCFNIESMQKVILWHSCV
jgi:hypothetical protein